MATVVNRSAPYSGLSNLMAMRGRMGDTELVHMSKPELKGLASLGKLSINPDTGLPEAFSLKSILPTIAGIGAAVATGGSSLLIPALATGLTSAAVNKDIGRGLFDGLLSYAGGSIMKGLSGGTEAAEAIKQVPITPEAEAVRQNMVDFVKTQGPNAQWVQGEDMSMLLSQPNYTPAFTATQNVAPGIFSSGLQAGQNVPIETATRLGVPGASVSGLPFVEQAKYFAPQAAAGIGGSLLMDSMTPKPYEPEPMPQEEPYVPEQRTITRVPLRNTPVTQTEALSAATGTGTPLRFFDYKYAKNGGLLALAEGGGLLEDNNQQQQQAAANILKVMIAGDSQRQAQKPFTTGTDLPTQGVAEKEEESLEEKEPEKIDVYSEPGGSADDSSYASGGLLSLRQGGYFSGMVPGTEHGMKDNVAFKVKGGNIDMAMLSPGEYVIPADVVAMLGNGNGNSGAKELDRFAKEIRNKAFGTKKQQRQLNAKSELNRLMG